MNDNTLSKIDEYGFARPGNHDLFAQFMSEYIKILAHRSQRWSSTFKTNRQFTKSKTLKRFVRKGIPSDYRTECWMFISGAEKIKKDHPLSYDQLKENISNSSIIEAIQIDLPRTFPDNIYFTCPEPYLTKLYYVLAIFAHQNPEVGYCQGLNYIAGLLLLATKDEEATFWLLKTLVEHILPKYYIPTMSGLLTDLDVLNALIEKSEPAVHKHIQNVGMPWAMGTTKWFICLYAEIMTTETVLRIWDCLFYEGSKIIFRVALALIKLHKDVIMQTSDLGELIECFKNMKSHKRVINCHHFMQDVFKLSDNLSIRTIQKLRTQFSKEKPAS